MSTTSLSLFIIVINIISWAETNKRTTVRKTIENGDIRGFSEFILNRQVEHYLGIPFAQPPINELRFRHARPMRRWNSEKDCTKPPPSCWQPLPGERDLDIPAMAMWLNNTAMSEDCLYLNVWRPMATQEEIQSKEKKRKELKHDVGDDEGLPVMVWIYGGGFTSGTSTLEVYNGAYLAARTNVVVVSMQYRLGPLGFLYLGNDDMPGNQGLMDQVLALQWVWRNIHFFGGNPKRVTLFGESAGAAAVSLHLLSPLSRMYFSQAIMQSGSALCNWAVERPKMARHKTYLFAEANGCFIDQGQPNHRLLTDCMRGSEAHTLTQKQYFINRVVEKDRKNILKDSKLVDVEMSAALFFDVPFKPVIDNYFLPHSPEEIIRRGDHKRARIMLGVNKDEGMFYLMYGLTQFLETVKHTGMFELPIEFYPTKDHDPADFVQQNLLDKIFLHPLLIQPVLFEYQIPTRILGRHNWSPREVVDTFDDMAGDFTFKCPVIDFAEMYAQSKCDVYLYSFEQRTKNVTWPEWAGVMHGYEIEYVFGMPFSKAFQKTFYSFTEEEKAIAEKMMRYWGYFAYTGDPNLSYDEFNTRHGHQWPRYEEILRRHLIIKAPASEMKIGNGLRRRQCLFWSQHMRELYKKVHAAYAQCPRGEYDANFATKPIPDSSFLVSLLLVWVLS